MNPSSYLSRRDFLARTGSGLGALALDVMLRQDARGASKVEIDPINPYLPGKPHFAGKAKSVIFLYMVGGPSQVDTFDYKPLLQKLDGQPLPESFRDVIASSKFINVLGGSGNLMG